VKDDGLYLIHILECIDKITTYTQEGHKKFIESGVTQDAVIRNFEIIGEAAKQISPELKQKYADVPWKTIAGFRDVLIHDYMGVDIEEVWGIVERDIPNLKSKLASIVADLKKTT